MSNHKYGSIITENNHEVLDWTMYTPPGRKCTLSRDDPSHPIIIVPLVLHLDAVANKDQQNRTCWIVIQITDPDNNAILQEWDTNHLEIFSGRFEDALVFYENTIYITFDVRGECGGNCRKGKVWMAYACKQLNIYYLHLLYEVLYSVQGDSAPNISNVDCSCFYLGSSYILYMKEGIDYNRNNLVFRIFGDFF